MDTAIGSGAQLEVVVAAPVDAVWRAVRDPAGIRRWYGWDAPGSDDETALRFVTDATESASEHRVTLDGGDAITLYAQGASTLVRLTRVARGAAVDHYDDGAEGWRILLQQLRFALERHPDDERRTACFTGSPAEGGDPRDELALLDLAETARGSRYDDTVVGQRVGGELWFASEHLLVLTVDEWGDGLLVLAATPASDTDPDGAATAALTTYGLDEQAFIDLAARWREWWSARYPS